MSKTIFNMIVICAGLVFLYSIATEVVSERKVPSISELASTTIELASTTAASDRKQADEQATSAPSVAKNDLASLKTATIYSSKGTVKAFVAASAVEKELGLSGQTPLPSGVGMLFAFDSPGRYGIWMKDMSFPLDLIWIDSNKKVAGVTKNVLPSSYPFVFMPPKDILYVLEMGAGSVAPFGLTTGTTLKFSL